MSLDPVKLQQVIDGAAQLESRFDSLMARRMADAAAKAQRRADKAKAKADTHLPSETPPSENIDWPQYDPPAFFPPNFMDEDPDREELRQGALSKEQL